MCLYKGGGLFEEFTHKITEAGKATFWRVGQEAGDPGRANLQLIQRSLAVRALLAHRRSVSVLFRPSTN